jgi:hypothetical protein
MMFKRAMGALCMATAATLIAAGGVLAHAQIVSPPGQDGAVVSGPISNAWAQAHCNAASPAIIADRSGGVVQFLPAATLPCPAVPNPGGQVHGD